MRPRHIRRGKGRAANAWPAVIAGFNEAAAYSPRKVPTSGMLAGELHVSFNEAAAYSPRKVRQRALLPDLIDQLQ